MNEIFNMNGYEVFVWSSFVFTLVNFVILYSIIKIQYEKERNKFVSKFGSLDLKRAEIAKSQTINREILSSNQSF
tara:strand:+ start:507 stop:731 length:225 start_codon:yes stop_codon:yes gene_type:complete